MTDDTSAPCVDSLIDQVLALPKEAPRKTKLPTVTVYRADIPAKLARLNKRRARQGKPGLEVAELARVRLRPSA